MPPISQKRELAFLIKDLARMVRTYADQRAGQFGMSYAQWAVLVRLSRAEGSKQSELADVLDIQPITLTRLVDRLCDNGLIERRADPTDRRAKRLFLTPAARPVVDRLHVIAEELTETVFRGIEPDALSLMISQLAIAKENVRNEIQKRAEAAAAGERHV
ncbi:MAG TPA: MarR family transcriptional regulator [Xanthobacteraceae bacterium]|jgi:MarR family transcriptional regulator for hemolysin|nr:MarR family transcriptional regulator [Xanthobacteraceae bacterium]